MFFLEIVLIRLHSRQVNVESPIESWGDFLATGFYPFVSLMGGALNSSRSVHSRRVSSVGGYCESSVTSRPITILLIGCLSGAVFGGIHCLAWNVLFEGHAEQILWRAASLAIVSAPVCFLLLLGYAFWGWDGVSTFDDAFGMYIPIITISIYIVARVVLIVLILMSFQSLPPGIYDTVAWTNFIPHL
jgi:hypothetical protein